MSRTAFVLVLLSFTPTWASGSEPTKQKAWLLLSNSPIHQLGEITLPGKLTLNQNKPLPRVHELSKVKIIWFGELKAGKRGEDTIVVEEAVNKWATYKGTLEVDKVYVRVDSKKEDYHPRAGDGLKAVYFGVPAVPGPKKEPNPAPSKAAGGPADLEPRSMIGVSDVKNLVYPQFWKLPAQEVIPKFGKDPGQEDYEDSKVFIFNSPAHFPLPRFGARGEPMDTAGAVIHEEMRVVVWKEGWYEVVFSLGIPSAPVTIRLQLAVHRRDCPLDPIILTIPPIAMNPDTASQGNWVGSLHRIHHEGFSVRLRDLWHELGDPHTSSVTRTGAARFGPLP